MSVGSCTSCSASNPYTQIARQQQEAQASAQVQQKPPEQNQPVNILKTDPSRLLDVFA